METSLTPIDYDGDHCSDCKEMKLPAVHDDEITLYIVCMSFAIRIETYLVTDTCGRVVFYPA